jgi:hypothetical protein
MQFSLRDLAGALQKSKPEIAGTAQSLLLSTLR